MAGSNPTPTTDPYVREVMDSIPASKAPAQAAQRNYLQSLHAEVAEKGVYVGMLYIGAAIEHSAFHTEMEKVKAAGEPVWEMPSVDPAHLADPLIRAMKPRPLSSFV